MSKADLIEAFRAAKTLTNLLEIDSVGVRVVLNVHANLPVSDETKQAVQAIDLALQKELWCPVHLQLGVGLHVPEWIED